MYREQIEAYVDAHTEEMLEDIKVLCRINSEKMPAEPGKPFGAGPDEALKAALKLGEKYGFATKNYDGYVGTIDSNDMEAQLDMLAHMDVVPAGDGWKLTTPFEPVVIDGCIYGRGTADDKGPAVAALYAMRAIKELGIPQKKRTRLILGTDEECGSGDIPHYYAVEKEAPMTFSPDSHFPVTNIEKGSLSGDFHAEYAKSTALPRMISFVSGTKVNVVPSKAEAVFEGLNKADAEKIAKSMEAELDLTFDVTEENGLVKIVSNGANGHASTPWKGKNALTGLLAVIEKLGLADCGQMQVVKSLNKLMPHKSVYGKELGIEMKDELSGPLTLAFSILSMDEEKMHGNFDSRCPLCSNEENVLKVAKANMAAENITLTNDHMRPPHHVSGDSVFVKTLNKCFEEYTGLEGKCVAIGGGTYVHDLENGVAFGASMPGVENRMHGPDEFANVEDLVKSAKIFAQVIVDLCC